MTRTSRTGDFQPTCLSFQIGRLYAAKFEGEWHRVEVVDVSGIYITSYFIDHGDREMVFLDCLRELDEQFLCLAPQALSVRLLGLEQFEEDAR